MVKTMTFKDDLPEGKYEGWTNYQTWNVALWVNNDEGLYNFVKDFNNYRDFARALYDEFQIAETPDGIALNDSALNIDELDAEFFED